MKLNTGSIPRRSFLQRGALFAIGFAGLRRSIETGAHAADAEQLAPLRKDPDEIMDLLPGFAYHAFSRVGEKMDDGLLVPGNHDGMGAFAGPGGATILVRNHEIDLGARERTAIGKEAEFFGTVPREKYYDAGSGKNPALGGTSTLLYNTRERRLERHFLSLIGTLRNCAGGITPWKTWITCEEDTPVPNMDGSNPDDSMEKEHGYNFEVPARLDSGLVDPLPLKAMGRFRHEAVAVEPKSGVIYQTEDRHDGLFYRFKPKTPGRLHEGGTLEALRIKEKPAADTRNWRRRVFPIGQRFAVEWVPIRNVESPDDDLRFQGYFEKGAARFARGEGCWHGNNSVYFACTNGGPNGKGQIWKYNPSPAEGTRGERRRPATLELFVEPNDGNIVENADNLTVAPWGDLIVCEDGGGAQYLLGVTRSGRVYKIGMTKLSELAGACFSPDGSTLFVNIFSGITLAITGPWETLKNLA